MLPIYFNANKIILTQYIGMPTTSLYFYAAQIAFHLADKTLTFTKKIHNVLA